MWTHMVLWVKQPEGSLRHEAGSCFAFLPAFHALAENYTSPKERKLCHAVYRRSVKNAERTQHPPRRMSAKQGATKGSTTSCRGRFFLCEQAYAAFEAADGHPSRAALVLERAESEGCCLHERVWVTHSDLLLAQMGAKGQVCLFAKYAR